MTTMGYVAQEVRKIYLSKLKKVNPYKCNVMFPKVRLSQLNAKVMEKYTRQHKGENDQNFKDEEEEWILPSCDDWANDDQQWNMSLLEPFVEISYESNMRQGKNRKHGRIVSRKKKGSHFRVSPVTDKRTNPIGDIPIKQEIPDSMVEILSDVTEGTLANNSPNAPTLTMFQVPSAILPVYMVQPPPALENTSHNFPLSNSEDLFTRSSHQTRSTRTQKSPRQADKERYYNKDNLEANIKQELPEHVIVMPLQSDLHSDEPITMPGALPMPSMGNLSTNEDDSVQKYLNGKSSEVCDDPLVSGFHRSLKELTQLLQKVNNKNLQCDEKLQKLKEDYNKKIAIIGGEKKVNEKEIDRILSLIHNWKQGEA